MVRETDDHQRNDFCRDQQSNKLSFENQSDDELGSSHPEKEEGEIKSRDEHDVDGERVAWSSLLNDISQRFVGWKTSSPREDNMALRDSRRHP